MKDPELKEIPTRKIDMITMSGFSSPEELREELEQRNGSEKLLRIPEMLYRFLCRWAGVEPVVRHIKPECERLVRMNMNVSRDLLKRVDSLAGELGCTRSKVTRMLLEKQIDEYERNKKHG